jgi:outer membrane murein-binding lipoprotein Lpp
MRRALALAVVAVGALLLAGCTPTVSMNPAPQATSARCAGVIVRLPDTVGSAARRATDAQATAAWGLPASVTLTCGVTSPALATAQCTTILGVDWLLEEQRIDGADRQVLTTYGRSPGTQVVLIDPTQVSADTALNALSEPIATATRRTGARCLSISETTP